jgi:hypothetical protein
MKMNVRNRELRRLSAKIQKSRAAIVQRSYADVQSSFAAGLLEIHSFTWSFRVKHRCFALLGFAVADVHDLCIAIHVGLVERASGFSRLR